MRLIGWYLVKTHEGERLRAYWSGWYWYARQKPWDWSPAIVQIDHRSYAP